MLRPTRLFVFHALMTLLPPTRLFALKRVLLRWCGARVGANVRVVSSIRVHISGGLDIGDDTWIGHEVLICGGSANVSIGKRVDIAPRVSLITGSHVLDASGHRAAGAGYSLPITVEDGAWIGAASTLLGGVTVGAGSVVGAGALINEDVPAGTVFGGVPARKLRSLV